MQCKSCGATSQGKYDFCPNCGAYIKHQSEHRLNVSKLQRSERSAPPAEPPKDEPSNSKVTPLSTKNGSAQANGNHVSVVSSTALIVPVTSKALSRSFARPLQPKQRDPFPTYAGMIIFMAIWLLAVLIGFGVAGLYQGLQDQQRIALATSAEHKDRAKAYIQEGNTELAIEELKYAYRFNPKDSEIVELLNSLQPTPVPQAAPATPTAVAVSQSEILGAAFNEARTAYEQKDYENAASALEGLRRVEPGFRKQEVEEMLFNAYVSLARQYLDEERFEEAVQKFDKALGIRKDDNVGLERYLAANYFRGLSSWAADWKRAVESFAEVVKINPKYLDAFNRLYQARIEYGDYLMARGAPCIAAEQYAAAIIMGVNASLQSKQVSATAACGNAPAPNQTPVATGTRAPGQTPAPPSNAPVHYVPSTPAFQATNDSEASVRGQVVDKLGKPVGGLQIAIFNSARSYERVETTDPYGFFSFDGLQPGVYGVRIANDPSTASALISVGSKQRVIINYTAN